ncbi:MAG: SIMPL domain-containing protein [Patescibacteria group bacterium]
MELPEEQKKRLSVGLVVLVVILCLYFGIKTLAEFRAYGMMGSGSANTITLSGHGEVNAVPDIATVYFTIRQEGKTVKEAQDKVVTIEKKALDFLRASGVAEKDIRTENASFNPKYEYQVSTARPDIYPPPGKQVVVGYEAYESLTVKVRNTDDAGKIIEGLGGLGVTELSGPNFMIDDEDALQAEARREAIVDAREKAKILAKDLGVRLGRVSSFSESGNYPIPIYARAEFMVADGAAEQAAELPKGENTITSDVNITYEIR